MVSHKIIFEFLMHLVELTAASLRGAPPSKCVNSPFAATRALEATQNKVKKGSRSYISTHHDLEHFPFFFSF